MKPVLKYVSPHSAVLLRDASVYCTLRQFIKCVASLNIQYHYFLLDCCNNLYLPRCVLTRHPDHKRMLPSQLPATSEVLRLARVSYTAREGQNFCLIHAAADIEKWGPHISGEVGGLDDS